MLWSFGKKDEGGEIWGQRFLKYYQYLSSAANSRVMMIAYINDPNIANMREMKVKGFGYYANPDWFRKAALLEDKRHWGLSFHWLPYKTMAVDDGRASVEEEGKDAIDEEGNLVNLYDDVLLDNQN